MPERDDEIRRDNLPINNMENQNNVFEDPDITNSYREHDIFFQNIDNSKKARQKRANINRTFRGYSNKMIADQGKYDANDIVKNAAMKEGMENRAVTNGFLEISGNNPIMAFATEVSENINEPPYFETHINETSHGSNIANISQHSFVRFHATVYNKTLGRIMRYVFAVGHHQRGLLNDYHIPSTIAMRKQVTYDDVRKGFAFINRYRINRSEDWKLLSTNCNRFAKSVAESMGFGDMAELHNTVSCVGSFKKIREAMYQKLASKTNDIQFFSMEQFSKKEMESVDLYEQAGDIQSNQNMVKKIKSARNQNMMGISDMNMKGMLELVLQSMSKELKVKNLAELEQIKENYNEAAGKNKHIWFKKKKQRQIAVYDAYKVMREFALTMFKENNEYTTYFKGLQAQVEKGKIDRQEFEKERDLLRASLYDQFLAIVDDFIFVSQGLKETSVKALKLKGDIMSRKAMMANDGDIQTIDHKGFGQYHAYAMDQFLTNDMEEGIYTEGQRANQEDVTVDQIASKLADARDADKSENIAVNGHFIIQRIINGSEGMLINMLPNKNTDTPMLSIGQVFGIINASLAAGEQGGHNQSIENYMQMLVNKNVSYGASAETMSWTMVQFIIMAVKDLWKIKMKMNPVYSDDECAVKNYVSNMDQFFNALYDTRSTDIQFLAIWSDEERAANGYAPGEEFKRGDMINRNIPKMPQKAPKKPLTEEERRKLQVRIARREAEESTEVDNIIKYINEIYANLKRYANSVYNPAGR